MEESGSPCMLLTHTDVVPRTDVPRLILFGSFVENVQQARWRRKTDFFILLGYLLVSLNTILISSRWLWSFSLSSFSNRVTATYYSLTSYFTIFRILHASRLAKKEVLNFSDFVHLLRESSFFVQSNIFTYVCTFTGICINALVIFMYSH